MKKIKILLLGEGHSLTVTIMDYYSEGLWFEAWRNWIKNIDLNFHDFSFLNKSGYGKTHLGLADGRRNNLYLLEGKEIRFDWLAKCGHQ